MKKNQLQFTNLKTLLVMAAMLLSVSWAQAAIYYLTSAGAGSAQNPASWNTIAAGGGTPATNFSTSGDIFIIPTGINGSLSGSGNVSLSFGTGVTLQLDGTLNINGGNNDQYSVTVNGSIEFSNTSSNQLIVSTPTHPNTTNTFTLSNGATL